MISNDTTKLDYDLLAREYAAHRDRMPLSFYFPETIEVEMNRFPPVQVLYEMMRAVGFSALKETLAEQSYELIDI